jgi:hypothetical protein
MGGKGHCECSLVRHKTAVYESSSKLSHRVTGGAGGGESGLLEGGAVTASPVATLALTGETT